MLETPLVQQFEEDGQKDVQYGLLFIRTLHNYADFIIKVNYDMNTVLMTHLITFNIWFSQNKRLSCARLLLAIPRPKKNIYKNV